MTARSLIDRTRSRLESLMQREPWTSVIGSMRERWPWLVFAAVLVGTTTIAVMRRGSMTVGDTVSALATFAAVFLAFELERWQARIIERRAFGQQAILAFEEIHDVERKLTNLLERPVNQTRREVFIAAETWDLGALQALLAHHLAVDLLPLRTRAWAGTAVKLFRHNQPLLRRVGTLPTLDPSGAVIDSAPVAPGAVVQTNHRVSHILGIARAVRDCLRECSPDIEDIAARHERAGVRVAADVDAIHQRRTQVIDEAIRAEEERAESRTG